MGVGVGTTGAVHHAKFVVIITSSSYRQQAEVAAAAYSGYEKWTHKTLRGALGLSLLLTLRVMIDVTLTRSMFVAPRNGRGKSTVVSS